MNRAQALKLVRDQIENEIVRAAEQETIGLPILQRDEYLKPHWQFFHEFRRYLHETRERILGDHSSLLDFAAAHEYFGLHFQQPVVAQGGTRGSWLLREWAPNATSIYLIGQFSNWQKDERYRLQSIGNGNWEIRLEEEALRHLDLYRLWVEWPGGSGERIPAYCRRVVQDEHTKIFSAQVWRPEQEYHWRVGEFQRPSKPLLIYEAHVGMAQEAGRIGTYWEFKEYILPRIAEAGYSAIQLMGIQEHPYYGSFGYQVSSFFAPSSRFGTPEELKELIDRAHELGLAVFLDIVHSHAVKNEVEGLSRFDGTHYQFFHAGARGEHPVWDSRLFNYSKSEVIHFLLSNVRYWIDAYHFDGFRFDGVTSMLYMDHGLGEPFSSYDCYFNHNLDREALVYLCLANELAHNYPGVETIAEDVSGLPGLAAPLAEGGFGFDYRLAMGIPDFWTRTIKKARDEDWNVEWMFWELINRRYDEKTISYAESHDQALVGDQTIIFRLLQSLVYDSMRIGQQNHLIERGMALHCMIRLITATTAGHGYLNFMGNEFGHPEWIDFPREGNNWSYHYARRQWSLVDNPDLQYARLGLFDKRMVEIISECSLYKDPIVYKHYSHVHDQILLYSRSDLLFCFNFNPTFCACDYPVDVPAGHWKLVLCSDDFQYGGLGRVPAELSFKSQSGGAGKDKHSWTRLNIPSRTALVFKKVQ